MITLGTIHMTRSINTLFMHHSLCCCVDKETITKEDKEVLSYFSCLHAVCCSDCISSLRCLTAHHKDK
jgi:hypothetical protein